MGRVIKAFCCFGIFNAAASWLVGQPPPAALSFEVASIKRHDQTQLGRLTEITPTQYRRVGHPLGAMIIDAYKVRPDQIVGPDWIRTETYDVLATIPTGSDVSQIPAMLRNLLEERFLLRIHWENRDRNVYLLRRRSERPLPSAAESSPKRILLDSPRGRVDTQAVTFEELADTLTHCCSDRFIVDETGIAGRFDFVLDLGREGFIPGLVRLAPGADDWVWTRQPLSNALRIWGLELTPMKWPIRHLIIDAANKIPTPN